MGREAIRLLLCIAFVAGCDQPDVLLVCHNSNCVAPADPERDDTLAALRESLALEDNGRPLLDGYEIDLFWRGSDGVCLFAHDLNGPRSELASEAAQTLADHIAQPGPATHGGGPLRVFIELKSYVGVSKSERHTPEQRILHAQCGWAAYQTIADAATASGKQVEFAFAAFEPLLLRALIDNAPTTTPFPYAFESFYGIPKPLDSETRPLSDYAGLPISIVEFHAQWILDAQWEAVRSDYEIGFYMFSVTTETLQTIRQYQPSFVNTNEARMVRRWLDR